MGDHVFLQFRHKTNFGNYTKIEGYVLHTSIGDVRNTIDGFYKWEYGDYHVKNNNCQHFVDKVLEKLCSRYAVVEDFSEHVLRSHGEVMEKECISIGITTL